MEQLNQEKVISIEDKLYTVKRRDYVKSHISLDPNLCKECASRMCVLVCPAQVYKWDELKQEIDIQYEDCLECGSCRIACEMQNIEWSNPVQGAGIIYRNS